MLLRAPLRGGFLTVVGGVGPVCQADDEEGGSAVVDVGEPEDQLGEEEEEDVLVIQVGIW
jgi:hypothetical protein